MLNENDRLIETHCHLTSLAKATLEETLQRCQEANIQKIMTISAEPGDFQKVINLALKSEIIYCTQGIHPHDAKDFLPEHLNEMKNNIQNYPDKIRAIGEIGLDYHYDFSPRQTQIDVFEQQLELAIQLDLPVVIHTRESDEDCLSILKNFSANSIKKGVLHSYTSGLELASYALSENFFLGFNGIITFKNAQNVRDILQMTPVEKIVIETDSPYLAPIPYRGKENNPSYLPFIAKKVSEVKDIEENELLPILYNNSCRLFDWT